LCADRTNFAWRLRELRDGARVRAKARTDDVERRNAPPTTADLTKKYCDLAKKYRIEAAPLALIRSVRGMVDCATELFGAHDRDATVAFKQARRVLPNLGH
jgi:hypothetical protein